MTLHRHSRYRRRKTVVYPAGRVLHALAGAESETAGLDRKHWGSWRICPAARYRESSDASRGTLAQEQLIQRVFALVPIAVAEVGEEAVEGCHAVLRHL